MFFIQYANTIFTLVAHSPYSLLHSYTKYKFLVAPFYSCNTSCVSVIESTSMLLLTSMFPLTFALLMHNLQHLYQYTKCINFPFMCCPSQINSNSCALIYVCVPHKATLIHVHSSIFLQYRNMLHARKS